MAISHGDGRCFVLFDLDDLRLFPKLSIGREKVATDLW